MFDKTNETKVLRDPVHGYIHVKYQVIWDCINAKEFQRLHRIHQLGGDFQIYHTAEHSRFSHSLGVYEITRRMCEEVDSITAALSEYEKFKFYVLPCCMIWAMVLFRIFLKHFIRSITNK